MEELVAAGELPLEQLQVVGYALLLIHARCRYSDAIRPTSEPWMDTTADGEGYIETTTRIAKTIKAKVYKDREMCIIGMALGVSGQPWASTWVRLRRKAGLGVREQGTLNPVKGP
eukprot:3846807-Amphidinium_carterae.1